jgi:hypothetical protein
VERTSAKCSPCAKVTNPVCERRVDLLVCGFPLHRHSYIGFILAFASSIHKKQQGDETASNASTTAPNAHRSSVSSWMSNLQRRFLRAAPSVKPTSKCPKLHSPIIRRTLTDLPAPTKAPLSEPAYRNCDNRLEPAIQRPDRRRSSIAKM